MPGWTSSSALSASDQRVVTFPDSPGYSPEQAQRREELLQRLRELSVVVGTHPWWSTVEAEQRVAARMALKRAHKKPAAGAEVA